jgi:RNA polymerase sigma factor (TIGR02999 family)
VTSDSARSVSGVRESSDELLVAVYGQLRAIAQRRLHEEAPGHTLQATALVHEAFLRIGQGRTVPFKSRAHFYVAAAEAMRRILIDHARSKRAAVRRIEARAMNFASVAELAEQPDSERILALDAALERLERTEPEVAGVVRLRFFAGLTVDETAQTLAISPRQVDRLWAYARVWLSREVHSAE